MGNEIQKTRAEQQPQYAKVTFNDSQNGKKKTFEIPIGTKIATTNSEYEIKGDGIYLEGKKVDDIPVILPQMTALEVFDTNKDKKIDIKDSSIFEKNDKSVAEAINDKLARNGSKFYVEIIRDEDGSFEEANACQGGFFAFFREGHWEGEVKSFDIRTPEYQQYAKAEEERIQKEREAEKPWWKFW